MVSAIHGLFPLSEPYDYAFRHSSLSLLVVGFWASYLRAIVR
jgi:hypothetical protein